MRSGDSPCGRHLLDAAARLDDVWLVGGAVRDILLGNARRWSSMSPSKGRSVRLSELLGGTAQEYERFGTATVEVGACRFDLARTRSERYAEPGALPEVAPAPIDRTTWRARRERQRDRRSSAGRRAAIGPRGRSTDLRAGVLRVLHDESLRDDPTRVWRIARYAARLGLHRGPADRGARARSPARARSAASDSATSCGSRSPRTTRAWSSSASRSSTRWRCPDGLRAAPRRRSRDALALLPGDGRRDLLVARSLLRRDGAGAARALARPPRSSGTPTTATSSRRLALGHRRAAARRRRAPAAIARAARGAPIEAVALAGGDNARRWIDELRDVRLEIGGDDLIAAGVPEGPDVGARLQRALDAKLDGPGERARRRAAPSRSAASVRVRARR